MKINDCIHGFTVKNLRKLKELNATMVEMVYEKNGAELIWLDRDDRNLSYAITFKTVPGDSSGVFHILEHSVLNGSEKFPLKEPFVDLLKGSMQTFLNAMTFPDKTMYPVSSRNRKDFLNLMDVYTDAVFHPLIYKRKETFLQEGWHYEWDESGKLNCSGVVYSEMQGAFASPDTQLANELMRQLFPDCCYGYVSGGDPKEIPSLSYEAFLDNHRRYYHPSNAKIFLDGSIDLDSCLALLDGYLCGYDRRDEAIHIGEQIPVSPEEFLGCYEIEQGAPLENRAIWGKGFVCGDFSETVKNAGLQVLADVLTGSNEAPLRKAVLDSGLCESFSMEAGDNTKYLLVTFEGKNTDISKLDRLKAAVRETLQKLAEEGLDREQLEASINALEFAARERDYGSLPKGIVFAITAMDSWLYGGDPAASICIDDTFEKLRKGIDEGYFETLIRDCLLNNRHCASACLLPSESLGKERQEQLEAKLSAVASSLSEQEREQIRIQSERLLELQMRVDSPEEKACLPKLSLSDLAPEVTPFSVVTEQVDGTKLLIVPQETNGILYPDFYFAVRDLPLEDLPYLSFLGELFGEAESKKHSGIEIQAMLKKDLGSFSCNCEVCGIPETADQCYPFFVVSTSVLESKKDRVAPLLSEVLFESVLSNRDFLSQMLKQRRIAMRESICSRGNSFAIGRTCACNTARGVFGEYTSGLEYYRWICKTDDCFEENADRLIEKLETLAKKVFCRERLALGITGQPEPEWVCDLLDFIPWGEFPGKAADWPLLEVRSEGIEIPSDVGFAAKGVNLCVKGIPFRGSMAVASQILSYDYLWNVIRVQNGAYGAGMSIGTRGELLFSTYRDPAAASSLDCMDGAPEYLRKNCPSQEDLNSLIISAVSESEPLHTPRTQGKTEILLTLSGISEARMNEIRREMLKTDKKELLRFADEMEASLKESAVSVFGGSSCLQACGNRLAQISKLS